MSRKANLKGANVEKKLFFVDLIQKILIELLLEKLESPGVCFGIDVQFDRV